MRFEIYLKGNGLFAATKCNCGLDSPRAKLGSVRNPSVIMSLETDIQVLGKSSIVTSFVGFADKNIDVMKCVFH